MTPDSRNRPNRWPQSPVWWIGGVALLGLVVVGVFGIRSLVVSSGEGTTGSGEGTALAARAEEERAGVEGDESPVDSADGIAPGDRPDEEISDPPGSLEEAVESSGSVSPEAEEADEPPAPVTMTAESSAAGVDEQNGSEFGVEIGSSRSWSMGHGWIVPWKDEILEVGLLKVGEERNGDGIYDETRLVVRSLSDSNDCRSVLSIYEVIDHPNCWAKLNYYPVPNEGGSIESIISDGERLIVASQMDEQAYISITDDLIDWNTTEIGLPRPSGLPDFVYASSYVDHLAVNPNGWLVKITTELSIDVLALAGIRETKTGIRSVYELQEDVQIQGAFDILLGGLFVKRWLDDERRSYNEWFFSWDDLGISHDTFCDFSQYCNMKGYIHSSNVSGSVWSALWGEDPIRVELPMGFGVSGRCCSIVGTHDGYMAISDPDESGYFAWFGSAKVFFSSDGIGWDLIDSPSGVFLDFWMARDGVVASNISLRGDDEPPGSNWDNVHWWLADSDGSNWRKIEELPAPPELGSFQNPEIRLATGIVAEPPLIQ